MNKKIDKGNVRWFNFDQMRRELQKTMNIFSNGIVFDKLVDSKTAFGTQMLIKSINCRLDNTQLSLLDSVISSNNFSCIMNILQPATSETNVLTIPYATQRTEGYYSKAIVAKDILFDYATYAQINELDYMY